MDFLKYLFYCLMAFLWEGFSGGTHSSNKDFLVGAAVGFTLLIILFGSGAFFCLKTDFPPGQSVSFALLVTGGFIVVFSIVCIIVESV